MKHLFIVSVVILTFSASAFANDKISCEYTDFSNNEKSSFELEQNQGMVPIILNNKLATEVKVSFFGDDIRIVETRKPTAKEQEDFDKEAGNTEPFLSGITVGYSQTRFDGKLTFVIMGTENIWIYCKLAQ